jgi:membrane fusion protein, multidrug efflux system
VYLTFRSQPRPDVLLRCWRRPRSIVWWAIAGLALSGGCEAGKIEPPPKAAPVPVVVATAAKKDVPVDVRNIGTVQPYATVSVKARVGGQIMRVAFQEGQDVKRGDLLFVIDRRTWEAAVAEAEANVKRDLARKENADADLRRAEQLVKTRAMSEEQHEQLRADANAAGATVEADRAAVDLAKTQLDYCTIRSPLDGRTGNLLVNEGNIVKADDTVALVLINQVQPIYVRFAVPEQFLPEIRKQMAGKPLEVEAVPHSGEAAEQGVLTFVDNAIDPNTGTIELKGTFSNNERQLWPGQFVDVVLRLTTLSDAIVVPKEAIQTGQKGDYVFVVKADNTVESRPVTKGIPWGSNTVVTRGLSAGDRVVTDGQLRLAPGARVTIKQEQPAAEGKGA